MTRYEISLMTDGGKLRVTEFYGAYIFQIREFRSTVAAVKHIQKRIQLGSVIHPNCQAMLAEWQDWAKRCS